MDKTKFTPRKGVAIDQYNAKVKEKYLPEEIRERVSQIVEGRIVYFYDYEEQALYPVERRSRGYKALIAPGPGYTYTLEIDGIHMHRISGIDPLEDSRLKVVSARIRRGHLVLDTCMGLGYTAILSLEMGARKVITVEKDSDVVWIAERNPYSSKLASPQIDVVIGDVTEIVEELPENYFDRIIHDPPRLSKDTGDLYGRRFYAELYRVLKPGGILFHYTGSPGRKRGLNIPGKIASRLRETGFHVVRRLDKEQGVIARKHFE